VPALAAVQSDGPSIAELIQRHRAALRRLNVAAAITARSRSSLKLIRFSPLPTALKKTYASS
jgi:hypothetical protein